MRWCSLIFPSSTCGWPKCPRAWGSSLYYFSPSVWAWRRVGPEAREAGRYGGAVFQRSGYLSPGRRRGHLPRSSPVGYGAAFHGRVEIHRFLNIVPEAMKIALMPGSRRQGIKAHLPTMLEAGRLIQEQVQRPVQYLVPVAAGIDDELIREVIAQRGEGLNLRLVHGYQYDVLAVADLVIVACGTATLEAALLEVPMVTVYRLSKTTYRIAKLLVKVPHVALPNVIAGREIVPELIQDEFTPKPWSGPQCPCCRAKPGKSSVGPCPG